jgi:hypothetical protein
MTEENEVEVWTLDYEEINAALQKPIRAAITDYVKDGFIFVGLDDDGRATLTFQLGDPLDYIGKSMPLEDILADGVNDVRRGPPLKPREPGFFFDFDTGDEKWDKQARLSTALLKALMQWEDDEKARESAKGEESA